MIATGTDIKPDRDRHVHAQRCKSRVLFEQMKGRGVRVIDPNELRAVTPDAAGQDALPHRRLRRRHRDAAGRHAAAGAEARASRFKALLEHVALGGTDPDMLSSLASRLARLDKQCGPEEHATDRARRRRRGSAKIAARDRRRARRRPPGRARRAQVFGLPRDQEPTRGAGQAGAASARSRRPSRPLADEARAAAAAPGPEARVRADHRRGVEGRAARGRRSAEARKEKAHGARRSRSSSSSRSTRTRSTRSSSSTPSRTRSGCASRTSRRWPQAIQAPPRSWTPEKLWRAYEMLDEGPGARGLGAAAAHRHRVAGALRAAPGQDELVPYAEQVRERFESWMAQQAEPRAAVHASEQVRWLEMMRDHIATSLEIEHRGLRPDAVRGGGRTGEGAAQVFGKELRPLLDELKRCWRHDSPVNCRRVGPTSTLRSDTC